MRARPGAMKLRGDDLPETPIWGFDGVNPGPPLRLKHGAEFTLRMANDLPVSIAIHWHGMRVPNAMDEVAIASGADFQYRFRPPDAGTFWYRASAPDQVGRGLYGLMIVDEAAEIDVDREVVLILDGWTVNPDGSLGVSASAKAKEFLTINARPSMDIPVRSNDRVRFRILNASTSQALTLRLDQHRTVIMAIDGQPSEPFAARDGRLTLAPGNRVDLFVDTLLGAGASTPIFVGKGGEETPMARLVYEQGPPARSMPRAEPRPLPPTTLPSKMDFARAQRAELPVDAIAGAVQAGPPLMSVKRGRTVVLALPNKTQAAYAMHLHGHHFRLLDALDDGWKPFWLDTVIVPPPQTTRIAFVADNPGKWPIRCTRLGDEVLGAQRWFEVT